MMDRRSIVRINLKWFFAIIALFPSLSFGAVCAGNERASVNTTILFVNGILNNSTATRNSAAALEKSLSSNGFDTSKVNIQCYFNGTEGQYDDVLELRIQGAISSKAKNNDQTNTLDGYYDRLGAAYVALAGNRVSCENYLEYTDTYLSTATQSGSKAYEERYGGSACTRVISGTKALANSLKKFADAGRVIVVAHSQGNFFLEAAYALLKAQGYSRLSQIQGVGVAAISRHPISNRYLTIQQDNAIYFLQIANTSVIKNLNYAPAQSNSVACAQNLPCTAGTGQGQNPLVLALLTKSLEAPSDVVNKLARVGVTWPDDKRALLHEFVEVYLNEKVRDTESNKTLPKKIAEMIGEAYSSLDGNVSTVDVNLRLTPTRDSLLTIQSDGTLWASGDNSFGQLGDGTRENQLIAKKIGSDYRSVYASGVNNKISTFAIKSDGTLWAWGDNSSGKLGDGAPISASAVRLSPIQIGSGYQQLVLGPSHTFALKNDGELWAWGLNSVGQLGDGTTISRSSPVLIGSDYKSVATDGASAHAIKNDGTLWAWGQNFTGQLGDGTTISRSSPVLIGSGYRSIFKVQNSSYAIKSDGTLWAWGRNASGQLGDGTTISRSSPVLIGSGYNSIVAGTRSVFAIKNDGTLWTWGNNENGQLGDGTTINRASPAQVGVDYRSIASVSAEDIGISSITSVLAIKSDGTLWAWGDNSGGQLGDGTKTMRSSPVLIGSGYRYVVTRGFHSLAIKSDETLWAWGNNSRGQFGDGTTAESLRPKQIVSRY
jgi:alpha-tubulin suppressor-like RCC1 family protein